MRPPLLLLPGMMLDERVFAAQMNALSNTVEVVVASMTEGDSVEQIARHVLDRAPLRFALAGLSMGGIVGFEVWRQAPHRVTHLALLDTTPHADLPERSRLREEQVCAVKKGQLREVLIGSLKPQYLAYKNRSNGSLLQSILEMGLSLGPDVFRRQSAALSGRPDSTATLPSIACPVLVLCGREDALCPVSVHATMANAIPRADLVVLAECGHLSPLEEPVAVSRALENLIERAA